MEFNDEQKQAIEHTGSPLLITAGPGSGKTAVITERIKFMLKNGLNPSEILCLTFSEKAAEELRIRLEQDDNVNDISDMQISTYHSFCRKVLFDNTLATGLGMKKGIIDTVEWPIARGKEAHVFRGEGENGPIAVKIFHTSNFNNFIFINITKFY